MAKTRRAKTTLRGRDAGTGRFIPVAAARRRRQTAVVERIPIKRPKRK